MPRCAKEKRGKKHNAGVSGTGTEKRETSLEMKLLNLTLNTLTLWSFGFLRVKLCIRCLNTCIEDPGQSSEMGMWMWSWQHGAAAEAHDPGWGYEWDWEQVKEEQWAWKRKRQWDDGAQWERNRRLGTYNITEVKEGNSSNTLQRCQEAGVGENLEEASHFTSSWLILPEGTSQFSRGKPPTHRVEKQMGEVDEKGGGWRIG